MRILCIIFLLLTTAQLHAGYTDYFNTDEFWSRIRLHEAPLPRFTSFDTVIIVASNRRMDTTLRFMTDMREDSAVHYFIVFADHGIWRVHPVPSLAEAIDAMPRGRQDWVIYTEGMGKLFTSDLDRGMGMTAQYGVNVLLLDYPSISTRKKSLGNYFFAIKNARQTPRYFLPVLDTFRQLRPALPANGHVSLFFHSMGNNLMSGIAKSKDLERINRSVWVDNLILNSACVKQRRHRRWLDKIRIADRKYINYNPEDKTLRLAHLVSFRKQLGERVRRPLAADAVYINFHTLSDKGHSSFLDITGRRPIPVAARQYYRVLFTGGAIDLTDTNRYRPTAYRHIGWDILPLSDKSE